jgi:flagellar motor switch protein FliN
MTDETQTMNQADEMPDATAPPNVELQQQMVDDLLKQGGADIPASPPVQSAQDNAPQRVEESYPEPKLTELTPDGNRVNINMLVDVPVRVTAELGRTRMTVKQILELERGSVIELDRIAGDPVDLFVNDHLIARGEVVIVDDNFGIRITEILAAPPIAGTE